MAIPYSQAEPFFDPDETLEQHLEKKDEVKRKNLTKKKKEKKKRKKTKKGKWGAAVKKGWDTKIYHHKILQNGKTYMLYLKIAFHVSLIY